MRANPVLVLFCGGMGGSPVEEMLAEGLRACVLDLLEETLSSGAYDGAVVVADQDSAAAMRALLPVDVEIDVDGSGDPFHFGRRLTAVVQRYELERPVYLSCGLPLLRADELAAVANALKSSSKPLVVTNNYYSADLAGFWPGQVLDELELPNNDRILPRLLTQEAGLTNESLPRTMANQFDLDSTGDMAVLSVAGGAGARLQEYLSTLAFDTSMLKNASRFFTDDRAEVLVTGRVGSRIWQFLETETACRVRMYSEERGMMAAGREASGEVRSLLAFHLKAVGPEQFFAELAEMAQCAFIDTRPLIAHLSLNPSREDRFLSDLMMPAEIKNPWLREFTSAARAAAIPVVLGGNSLVTGGLQLLSEAAWKERDATEAEYKAKGRAS